MLEREQVLLLNILKESLQGRSYDLTFPGNDSFLRLMKLARDHRVLALVCDTIYSSDSLQDSPLFQSFKQQAIRSAAMQKIETEEFLHLYRILQKKGISPLVVKGVICQNLYPRPLLRISTDDDLFIPDNLFAECHQLLMNQGLVPDDMHFNIYTSDEISYHQEGSPLYIELHRFLFSSDSKSYGHFNRFFEQSINDRIAIQIEEITIVTMNPTDHLLYLILHAFKHFLHSGIGIRPVCDIALLANHYHEEIEWNYIQESLMSVRAFDYTRALFKIIDRYLMPSATYSSDIRNWDIGSIDEEPLLLDILKSGLHGASSMSRLHSSTITLQAVSTGKKETNIIHSVFLPLKSMQSRYPYLKKAPFLLPVAWIQRIFNYLQETKNTPSDDMRESIKIGKDRVLLFQKYHVLQEKQKNSE